jgi:hypothetical protein
VAVDSDGEAGWDLLSRQPSQLSEMINTSSREVYEQVEQDEVTGGQKELRDGEEFGMSDTNADACREIDYQIVVMTY